MDHQQQQQDQQQQQEENVMKPTVAVYQIKRNPYKERAGRWTGMIQILCGIACMGFGIVARMVLNGTVYDPLFDEDGTIFGIVAWPAWGGFVSFLVLF